VQFTCASGLDWFANQLEQVRLILCIGSAFCGCFTCRKCSFENYWMWIP